MSNCARCALSIGTAAALLTGCGAAQPPVARPDAIPQTGAALARTERGSWILSEAKSENLLYVTDPQDNYAYLIALPSGKLVGKITGFDAPAADCSDAKGDVFIVDSHNYEIREYQHGAKSAFKVLNDHPWLPIGCSVDPITGDLAVANCCGKRIEGSLAIYTKAKGAAHYYQYPGMETYWFCTYDSRGNLFVDGIMYGSYNFKLLEILRGKHRLTNVTLSPGITGDVNPPILWDGKSLAIASHTSGRIYQYAINGSKGTLIHTTKLGGNKVFGSFWVLPNGKTRTLYVPIVRNHIASVGIYHYPAGGKPILDLYDVVYPFGATVSVAK